MISKLVIFPRDVVLVTADSAGTVHVGWMYAVYGKDATIEHSSIVVDDTEHLQALYVARNSLIDICVTHAKESHPTSYNALKADGHSPEKIVYLLNQEYPNEIYANPLLALAYIQAERYRGLFPNMLPPSTLLGVVSLLPNGIYSIRNGTIMRIYAGEKIEDYFDEHLPASLKDRLIELVHAKIAETSQFPTTVS
jgi:hypothetical protein